MTQDNYTEIISLIDKCALDAGYTKTYSTDLGSDTLPTMDSGYILRAVSEDIKNENAERIDEQILTLSITLFNARAIENATASMAEVLYKSYLVKRNIKGTKIVVSNTCGIYSIKTNETKLEYTKSGLIAGTFTVEILYHT